MGDARMVVDVSQSSGSGPDNDADGVAIRRAAVREVVRLLNRNSPALEDAATRAESSADASPSAASQGRAFAAHVRGIRDDVASKALFQSDSILNSLIRAVTEDARASTQLVLKANRRAERLKAVFNAIEELCESGSLGSSDRPANRELVTQISRALRNIGRTAQHAEDIIAIPSLAQEAIDVIEDSGEQIGKGGGPDLVQGYVCLVELEAASAFARRAVLRHEQDGDQDSRDRGTLADYFDTVAETNAKFEGALWSAIRNFINLGRQDPAALLAAVKVVEIQERRDARAEEAAKAGGSGGSGEGADVPGALRQRPKRWRARCLEEISHAIRNSTEPLTKLSKMLGESSDQGMTQTIMIDEVLEVANSIAADFTDVYDYSASCFPEAYNVFEFMMKQYTLGFGRMIDSIGDFADILSNRQILAVIKWISQYQSYLESLGVDVSSDPEAWNYWDPPAKASASEAVVADEGTQRKRSILSLDAFLHSDAAPNQGKGKADGTVSSNGDGDGEGDVESKGRPGMAGFAVLMQTYIARMKEVLSTWFANIVEAEEQRMGQPQEDEEGKLWTPALIDLFRIMNQQVSIVNKSTNGVMLLETSRTIIQVMMEFQHIESERLKSGMDLTLEAAIAILNTNLKAYDMALELADTIEDALDPTCRGAVDVENACRGFLQMAKRAVASVTACIVSDEGIQDTFASAFFGPEWCLGKVTPVLVATLEDYMQDVAGWIETSFLRRVAESLLDKVAEAWIQAFLANTPVIQSEVAEQMLRDSMQVHDFFRRFIPKAPQLVPCQRMEAFTDLVAADSVDSFVISYRLLIEVMPDFEPAMIENILSGREDITKREASNVMSQCHEVFRTGDAAKAKAARKQSNRRKK